MLKTFSKKMRIVFVTQSEPFYIKHFFNTFLKNYPSENIKGLVIQTTLNQKKRSDVIRKAVDFYGITGFIYMGAKYAEIKVTDAFSRFTNIQTNSSMEQIVKKYDVPILKYRSINGKDFLDFIKNEDIDLIVSVAASEIFKEGVLNAPRLGCINIHSAPLPKYRGMMPNFWTLYNNEEYAWVTIHKMVDKLDDGPIILQDKFKILPDETYNSLAKRSKKFATKVLLKVLKKFDEGAITYLSNDSSKATYYTFPTKKEIREFKRRGGRII